MRSYQMRVCVLDVPCGFCVEYVLAYDGIQSQSDADSYDVQSQVAR
jgi:hypothetical protein